MREIEKKADQQEAITFTSDDIEKGIKKLKRNKAADMEGWRNELIIEGGKEMKKRILKMFNEITKSSKIPMEWQQLKIKSIYKNKGSRQELTNRRGIFITSFCQIGNSPTAIVHIT